MGASVYIRPRSSGSGKPDREVGLILGRSVVAVGGTKSDRSRPRVVGW